MAHVKRLATLLLVLRRDRAARLIVVLEANTEIHWALAVVLALILEAVLGCVLGCGAQVDLQILHDVCLAIFEVVGDVGAHHAHLAVTLAVRAGLALIRHQWHFPAHLRTHWLVVPLGERRASLGMLLVPLALLCAMRGLDLGPVVALQHLLLLRLELRRVSGELLHDLLLLAGAVALILCLLAEARRGRLILRWLRLLTL